MALATSLPAAAQAPRSPTPAATNAAITAVEVARGLDHPWGLAFLPDGRMLVTERRGKLWLLERDGSARREVSGVPAVQAAGQGGLLGIAVSPTFARDRLVYLSFAEAGEGGAGTAVARGVLDDARLTDVRTIWRQSPKMSGTNNHWGSRLVFGRDGTLFVTTGDRYSGRAHVQDLSTTVGKVVRINADGTIPSDNPFVARAGAKGEIWSYGHRNLQGAALHPSTGQLWTLEHGARGGDELNHPRGGQELRLAGDHLRRGLLRREDRRRHGQGRHGAARVLLGSGDRAVGRCVLHRRSLRVVEGRSLRGLAHARAASCASASTTAG